jgi:uncharacterized protein YbcI
VNVFFQFYLTIIKWFLANSEATKIFIFKIRSHSVYKYTSDQKENKSEKVLQIIGHVLAEFYTNKRSTHGRRQFMASDATLY